MEAKRVALGMEGVWIIESGYTAVQFEVTNLFLFRVRGRFAELTGRVKRDPAEIGKSTVEATINAASVETGNARRDAHLRSSDFLDVTNYPEIQFESKSVERGTDRDTFKVVGELTIKSTTREVVLDVTEMDRSRSPNGDEVSYYAATTKIDRFDFGITYGRAIIGRDLKVVIHVQALRRS
jgi:polyisoprenoid-binding protein YceI